MSAAPPVAQQLAPLVAPPAPNLDIDIPAQPETLVRLSMLLADEDVNVAAIAQLVEADMALAAAVLKAVNSSLYGLRGRVQSVQQAVTYLGTREISGITFELGLRAAFPPAAELEPIWNRAGTRGLVMGRLGQALGLDAWAAHSAGVFEECGKAVLFRHAPAHYPAMLRAASCDTDLCQFERAGFGIRHDALGAALCHSWGLGVAAVACVEHHVAAQAEPDLQRLAMLLPAQRGLLALSVMAKALLDTPASADEAAGHVAEHAGLNPTQALRAVRRLQEQLAEAAAHGR